MHGRQVVDRQTDRGKKNKLKRVKTEKEDENQKKGDGYI